MEVRIVDPSILPMKYKDLGFLAMESLVIDLWQGCSRLNITWNSNEAETWAPVLQCWNNEFIVGMVA